MEIFCIHYNEAPALFWHMFMFNTGLKLLNKWMGLWYEKLYGAYKKAPERAKILSSFIFLISSAVSCQQRNSMTAFHVLFIISWQGSDICKYFTYTYNQYKCSFNACIQTNCVRTLEAVQKIWNTGSTLTKLRGLPEQTKCAGVEHKSHCT